MGTIANEKTPLNANKGDATFYFLDRKRNSTAVMLQEGGEATPLIEKDNKTGTAPKEEQRLKENENVIHGNRKEKKQSDLKMRKVPIKVEPKVYFANERTFLAWLHTSIILAAVSLSIVSFADQNPWSQFYGILLLPVSISFIMYALRQYNRRAKMIRRREPGPYEDLWGPSVLAMMLMLSIIASFIMKVYAMNS